MQISCNRVSQFKRSSLVMIGNVLDYYDFLLFAHLGYVILPYFTSGLDEKESHLLSLLLFGISFIMRPVGGYFFGRISDLQTRQTALSRAILWAAIATSGLALLPTYESIGIIATCFLVFFRLLQGVSVGGEYPTAGTYLMESHPRHQGLLSGILSASGTVGSLIALGFAWLCLQEQSPSWLWRVAFLLGAAASFISYFLRKNLLYVPATDLQINQTPKYSYNIARIATLMMSLFVGVMTWMPVTYTNFYLTKILHAPTDVGLSATLLAILSSIFFKPIFGKLSDKFDHFSYISFCAFGAIPLLLSGFYLIMQQNILGQVFLVMSASSIDGSVHSVMNKLFPKRNRSRSVNSFFMIGLGVGGLSPSLCGFVLEKTDFHFFPAIFSSSIALMTGVTFLYFVRKSLSVQTNMQCDFEKIVV